MHKAGCALHMKQLGLVGQLSAGMQATPVICAPVFTQPAKLNFPPRLHNHLQSCLLIYSVAFTTAAGQHA